MFILQQNNVKTKREDVTKQGSCKLLWRKLRLLGGLLLVFIQVFLRGGGWELEGGLRVGAYLILSTRWMELGGGGRLFKAGRLFEVN